MTTASEGRVGPRAEVLGVPIDPVTRAGFVDLMEALIAEPGSRILQPLNVDTLNQTQVDPWLTEFFRCADVVYADGQGVVWGAKALGQFLPERMTAADLAWDLAERWSEGQHSLYLLGGPPGLSERAAEALKSRYPGFRVAGTWRGHLSAAEDREALADIRRTRPDVLAVGFGTPFQERWIHRYRAELAEVPLLWPVGAMCTYIAGAVPRAPQWMLDNGLEWAFRFGLEPKRLFHRYIVGNPAFAARVAAQRLRGS